MNPNVRQLLTLLCTACLLTLTACQAAPPEAAPPAPSSQSASVSQAGPDVPAAPAQVPVPAPDLNGNGIAEEVRLVGTAWGDTEVQFFENGVLVNRESPGVYLCTLDGEDYILHYRVENEYPGYFLYSYHIGRFSGEPDDLFPEETGQWGEVSFDLSFGAPFHRGFDPEAIAAFAGEINGLLAHSVRLDERDGALAAQTGLTEDLDFLNSFPEVFVRAPEKSLLENLEAFQETMTRAYPPAQPGEPGPLPIEKPLDLYFASGVGAWSTWIHLDPDGAFTGSFTDADMGVAGEDYPGGTTYLCLFHGSFGPAVQLTPASWSLALEELVLTTGHPVGEEWVKEGVRYIASEPYGLDGADGSALEPGAQFILYAPEATGHAPGTELYGAYEFWTWWSRRNTLESAADTLGCWGLHSLETGYGFFS